MRKAPSILIPWLVWGLQFAKYSACARLYQCSRIVLGCSLHLCGFAQNKKIAASGRANSLGLPGFCVRLSTRCPNLLEPTQSWHSCRINHRVQLQTWSEMTPRHWSPDAVRLHAAGKRIFFWLNPLHSSHFTVCHPATWQTAPLLPLFAMQGILQACYETVMWKASGSQWGTFVHFTLECLDYIYIV